MNYTAPDLMKIIADDAGELSPTEGKRSVLLYIHRVTTAAHQECQIEFSRGLVCCVAHYLMRIS